MICVLSGETGAVAICWFHALDAGNIGQPPRCGPGGVSRFAGMPAVAPVTVDIGAAETAAAVPSATTKVAATGQRRKLQPPIWLIVRCGRMNDT